MTIESATYVSSLDNANPSGTDFKYEGDDHVRLIKSTLLNSFPNITGAITATHTELNLLDGKTSLGDASGYDTVPIANGGTGATTAADARTNLELVKGSAIGNVLVVSDVGGNAGLPALDGSQLTNIVTSPAVPGSVDVMTFKHAKIKSYFYGQL